MSQGFATICWADRRRVAEVRAAKQAVPAPCGEDRPAVGPEAASGHARAARWVGWSAWPVNLPVRRNITDSDDPARLATRYRDMLAVGSFLAITHLTDGGKPQGLERVVDEVRRCGTDAPAARAHDKIVNIEWRPNGLCHAGVGRKR